MSDDQVELDEQATEAEPVVDETDQTEEEWWQDPSMPWKHKPERSDLVCLAWIGFIGLWGLAMIPLRGWLLGLDPALLTALTGSRFGLAGMGALVKVGQYATWWWPMLAGVLMSIKFDWVYWWAGKLWGRGMIEVWAAQSERAARNYARAERWAIRWGAIGIFIAYVPIPLPIMAVVFVLAGASKMSWKKFMLLDAAATIIWHLAYFGLGYILGEPAAVVLGQYAKISNYVAIGLVVVVIGGFIYQSWQKAQAKVDTSA